MYTNKHETASQPKLNIKRRFREGEIKFLKDLVLDGALTVEKAAKKVGLTPDEFITL